MTTVDPSPAGDYVGRPPKKSGHLTLTEIAQLVARAIVEQHHERAQANAQWVYATDRDELVDFSAHQSVNANPSNHSGTEH